MRIKELKSKPCPFCGERNDLEYEFAGSGGYIKCITCGAMGPDDERAQDPECDIDAAFEAWNKRAGDNK